MDEASNSRLVNIVGALVLAVGDMIRDETERASGQRGAGPAAIVSIDALIAGRSVDQLRRSVDLTPSGAVRLVDRLVEQGLAVREPGHDARTISLSLTASGHTLAAGVRAARAGAIAPVLDVLTDDERTTLAALVDKMIAGTVERRLSERAGGHLPVGGFLCRLCDTAACRRDLGECPAANAAEAGS